MKRSQLAAQLYSFRDFIKTKAGLEDTLLKLKKMGYGSVQLSSSIVPMPEEELVAILERCGLEYPTSHEPGKVISEEPLKVIERLKKLGVSHVAYPYPNWVPTGLMEAEAFGRELEKLSLLFRKNGITLAYHNHSLEFQRFDGKLWLECIYEKAPSLEAELDTFWCWNGGCDPVEWIKRAAGRMSVIHLKDYGMSNASESSMMSIGEGNLDWDEIISESEKAGVRIYVVEHDSQVNDVFDSFAKSAKYLERFIMSEIL